MEPPRLRRVRPGARGRPRSPTLLASRHARVSTALSDTYSGYLDAGKGKHLHYFFTASLNAPATDPVVLWCE